MHKLPKLKIKSPFGYPDEICDLKDAEHRFNYGRDLLFATAGKVVHSYEELVQLAAQDKYKEQEFLELVVLRGGLLTGG